MIVWIHSYRESPAAKIHRWLLDIPSWRKDGTTDGQFNSQWLVTPSTVHSMNKPRSLIPSHPRKDADHSAVLTPLGASPDVRSTLAGGYDILRRQKWLILIVFALTVGAATLYVFRTTPEYQATSLLLVEVRPYDPADALSMGYISGIDNTNVTMHELVLRNSTLLFENVAEELAGTLLPVDDPPSTAEFAKRLRGMVEIEATEANVLSVLALGSTGSDAARLANVFAEEAVNHSQSLSRRRITASRSFLEQRIEESARHLASAEETMKAYLGSEGAVALDKEAEGAVTNVARVEAVLADAQIEYDMKSAALDARERQLAEIRPQLSRRLASGIDRELETSQARLADLELRLNQIYFQYPSLKENPDADERIAPLQAQIGQWKSRVDELSDRYVQEVLAAGGIDPEKPSSGVAYAADLERQAISGRIELAGLNAKIEALTLQKARYDGRLRTIPEQSMTLAQLERERSSTEQLYTFLEERLQEAMLAEEAETGSLHVLRAADLPVAPISPRPERILPLAALLGIVLGTGMGSLRNHLDNRIYTPADIEETGIPLLGVVPDLGPMIQQEFGGRTVMEVDGCRYGTNIVALLTPHSVAAEAYRHLYARLQPTRSRSTIRSVIVTSPEAAVGKSTTALNIAITAALSGRRTLLVDTDMRKPSAERYLGLHDVVSLQNVLSSPTSADLRTTLLKGTRTPIPNLHVITVPQPVDNPLEVLLSQRLRKLMEVLSLEFEFIVFDTPPLLLAPDAALLAPMCDSSVLVAAAGKTDTSALTKVRSELETAGADVAGVILNKFDPYDLNFKHTYGYLQHNYGSYYHRVAS